MKFFMHFPEVRVGYMGIDLSGGDITMTKHTLDTTDIRSVHNQIGGKTVT